MKKVTFLTILFILALLVSAWSPVGVQATAAATATSGEAKLTITNPLPKGTTVTLSGSGSYTFTVPAGGTRERSITTGVYHYKYQGCLGKIFSGVLPYKNGVYTLDIKPCKMVRVTIINPYFETFRGELKGWMNYTLTVKERHMESFEVVAGVYNLKYTCTPSNKGWEGKVRLHKNILWIMCN